MRFFKQIQVLWWLHKKRIIIAICVLVFVGIVARPLIIVWNRPLMPVNWLARIENDTQRILERYLQRGSEFAHHDFNVNRQNRVLSIALANLEHHEFHWNGGRERLWEEDIMFFAHHVVASHPLIINSPIWTSSFGRNPRFHMPPDVLHGLRRSFMFFHQDRELREAFFDEISILIRQIPELDDFAIAMNISRIIAMLNDSHSQIVFSTASGGDFLQGRLAVDFIHHYDENWHEGAYPYSWPHATSAYIGIAEIINTRLLYINGVYIGDIFEMMRPYFPMEIGVENSFRHIRSIEFIQRNVLRYFGVIKGNETRVPLTVRDVNGYVFTVYSPFVRDMGDLPLATYQVDYDALLYFARPDENYWFKHFVDESMIYVRLFRCREMLELSSTVFFRRVRDAIRFADGVDTFILDLRNNRGGNFLIGKAELIAWAMVSENRELMGNIYVIVDNRSYSRGSLFALDWRYFVDDVTIIGTPTAGTLNVFADTITNFLPNSNLQFFISTNASVHGEGWNPNSAVIPDIIVRRTLYDYMNNHDAVLEAIRVRAANHNACFSSRED